MIFSEHYDSNFSEILGRGYCPSIDWLLPSNSSIYSISMLLFIFLLRLPFDTLYDFGVASYDPFLLISLTDGIEDYLDISDWSNSLKPGMIAFGN